MTPRTRGGILTVTAVVLTVLTAWIVLHPPQSDPDAPRPPTETSAPSLNSGAAVSVLRYGGTYAEIATALSQERRPSPFARGTGRVYLAPQDSVAFGATAMAFTDGPVFFVPRSGPADPRIVREIARLAPASIVVCGSATTFARGVVEGVAGGRPVVVAGKNDRYGTNRALLGLPAARPDGHTGWLRFVTDGFDDIATAIAASYPGHPPLLVSPTDAASRAQLSGVLRQAEVRLIPLTPPERLPVPLLQSAAGPGNVVEIVPVSTPTAASVAAALRMHTVTVQKTGKDVVDTVVLANQNESLLAINAGLMSASRLLVLPPDGSAPPEVLDAIRTLRPRRVVALGDASSVPTSALQSVVGALTAPRSDTASGTPTPPASFKS